MKALKFDLENCYGIKKLKGELDFAKSRSVAIYAPNGSMKTSFAQTFDDIAKSSESKDRIFPEHKTSRSVTDEAGKAIPNEAVVVVRPYDDEFGHTEKTSTLLVNSKLRTEYEGLLRHVDAAAEVLVKALKDQARTKNKNLKGEISLSFTNTDDKFFVALART